MEAEIVVARCKEDVSWTSGFKGRVTIYDKSPGNGISGLAVRFSDDLTVVALPNVGREAHTYLWHITRNYDRLADVTLFTQGDPFAHVPQDLAPFDVASLIEKARRHPSGVAGIALARNIMEWDESGCLVAGWRCWPWDKQMREGQVKRHPLSFAAWYTQRVCMELPARGLTYFHGAIFAVRREVVQFRPAWAYDALIKDVEDHPHPEAAHYLERAWLNLWCIKEAPGPWYLHCLDFASTPPLSQVQA